MKKLSDIQNLIYGVGACLILVGVVMMATPVVDWAPYVYGVGAVCFSSMQMLARYDGANFTIRRLRKQQLMGAVLLLLAIIPLFMHVWNTGFARHNEWVICLSIAAWLELYTAFRIEAELKKEDRKRTP
jgi:uncharacterized membrane protein HdeD (DUF308 family)